MLGNFALLPVATRTWARNGDTGFFNSGNGNFGIVISGDGNTGLANSGFLNTGLENAGKINSDSEQGRCQYDGTEKLGVL